MFSRDGSHQQVLLLRPLLTAETRWKNPPHPGLSVRHDCIEPLGLTTTAAAKILGVTRQTLNNLINGKSGISADMALRLDNAFGGGAENVVTP